MPKTKTRGARQRRRLDPYAATDRLGEVKAQIADLKVIETELKAILTECGQDAVEGRDYRATVSRAMYATTDWEAVARKAGASDRLISANTRTSERVIVRVAARTGKE